MLETALKITGKFEGSGFDSFAGDFDGMGVSVGILQWNYGMGTLQKLLKSYHDKFGLIPAKCFPEAIDASAHMPAEEAVKFAKKMQTAEWKKAWKSFLVTPQMKEVQMGALKPYADRALQLQRKWELKSVRSYCFFFDVAVQNGSMKVVMPKPASVEAFKRIVSRADQHNRELWETDVPTAEQTILMQAAWERAQLATVKWRTDVFVRKATIAMGEGIVHGKRWDFTSLLEEPKPGAK